MLRIGFVSCKTSGKRREVSVPHYSPEAIMVGVRAKLPDHTSTIDLAVHRDGSWELAIDGVLDTYGTLS